MGTVAIDVNDMVEVNAVGIRALSNALGDDGARAYINQFGNSGIRRGATTPHTRVTASEIAEIIEQARAEAEARRDTGEGDYTAEKKYRPQMTFEESTARMRAADIKERARRGLPPPM